MTTFKMPGLSRYTFDIEGRAYGTKQLNSIFIDGSWYYSLYDDQGKTCKVRVREIIQYGKHVKEMNFIGMFKMMKLPLSLVEPKPYNRYVRKKYKSLAN